MLQFLDLRVIPPAVAAGTPVALAAVPLPIEPFISVGGSIIVAMIGGFFSVYVVREKKKAEAAKLKAEADAERDAKIDKILNQVANTHDSNLRDDLDEKFAGLEKQIRAGDRRTHQRIDAVVERLDRHIDGARS